MCTSTLLLFVAVATTLGMADIAAPTLPPQTNMTLEPASCPLEDQIAFTLTLPNAEVCAPSIGTVLTPAGINFNSTEVISALDNVCTSSCGGRFADYLDSASCNDSFGAETLTLSCTPTDGTASVGPYCRFALGDLDQSIFSVLFTCDNSTCAPGCKELLLQLKSQIGCCYQNVYNNTRYLTQLLNAQFLLPDLFVKLQQLSDPISNPWNQCNVTVPQECTSEPFSVGKSICITYT